MYEVIRRGKRHNPSIECLLDLIDKIAKVILLYGCEVWGFSDNYVIFYPRSRYISITKKTMQKFRRYGRQLGSFSSK
jgi:hypothetical protein